jgi:glycosyltransferase involved in cell wall biosynthesis
LPEEVLYVHFVPALGGATTSLSLLLKYIDRRRYAPRVLYVHPVPGPSVEQIRQLGVPVDLLPVTIVMDQPWYSRENLGGRRWRSLRPSPSVRDYLGSRKPALVHLNDFPPLAVGLTARQMGIPVVTHSRHVFNRTRPVLDPGRRLIREIERCSDAIVAISENEAAQFANSAKVSVVYNPLEIDSWQSVLKEDRTAIRSSLGLQEPDIAVLAPIPLMKSKGCWDFIRAAGLSCAEAPGVSWKFLIAGNLPGSGRRHLLRSWTGLGPEPETNRALNVARGSGLNGRLSLLGFRADMARVMAACDIVVFPSRMRECGRPSFEASALGKPVILTLPTKTANVVIDGSTGWVVPERNPSELAKAIVRLGRNPEERQRLGAEGKKLSVRFDAKLHAERIMDIYGRVLAERGSPFRVCQADDRGNSSAA